MEELIEALQATTNVKTCSYNCETGYWTITYKNGLNPDEIDNENLIDFLNNA